jgi:hypothetical protein
MDKRNIIRFCARFTKNLIKENPIKTFFAAIAATMAAIALNIPDQTFFLKVEEHYVAEGKHYYRTYGNRNALEFTREQPTYKDTTGSETGDMLKVTEIAQGAIALLAVGIIMSVFLIAVCIFGDEDSGLSIEEVVRETILEDLKWHQPEDGVYIKVAYSRIISKSPYRNDAIPYMGIGELFRKESYYTKQEQRDIKLDKLGI